MIHVLFFENVDETLKRMINCPVCNSQNILNRNN
jgi:transcription elongation factor Elf1